MVETIQSGNSNWNTTIVVNEIVLFLEVLRHCALEIKASELVKVELSILILIKIEQKNVGFHAKIKTLFCHISKRNE